MSTTTLTSKGQLTLPKRLRERLSLKPGDRLRVTADRQGRIVLAREPREAGGQLFGLLHHLAPKTPASVGEMRAAVRRRASEAHARSRR